MWNLRKKATFHGSLIIPNHGFFWWAHLLFFWWVLTLGSSPILTKTIQKKWKNDNEHTIQPRADTGDSTTRQRPLLIFTSSTLLLLYTYSRKHNIGHHCSQPATSGRVLYFRIRFLFALLLLSLHLFIINVLTNPDPPTSLLHRPPYILSTVTYSHVNTKKYEHEITIEWSKGIEKDR